MVQKTLRYGGDKIRALGMPGLVSSLKELPGLKQALSMNRQHLKTKVAPPKPETRQRLADQFTQDMEYVAQQAGRDVLPWPTWRDVFADCSEARG